jgi:group II intron reverse transcriptase/maturase
MKLINQILSPDNMRSAWEEVAGKHSAPGIDQVSVERWRRNWEERLVELAASVRTNTYHPQNLLRYSVPKKGGETRQISILTVTDRVIQRAVLRVVDDFFDKTFLDCSYGFRARRGVRDAIPAILAHREAGRQWVLDADIDDCVASLEHAVVVELFEQVVDDRVILRLLEQWLKVGAPSHRIGIPLGGVISPLLCNLVLHRLDDGLVSRNFHPIRYADDFCVFCGSEAETHRARKEVVKILENIKLRLEPAKTRITNFEEGFDFLGVHFYRDEYSFLCQQKKIEVKGEFDATLFYDYVPDGYE